MREIQLPLNQTQKVRLQRALNRLEALYSKASSNASVTVAETIPISYEDSTLKGHGTAERDGEVVATVCGVVERVNKLVYVRTLRARYKPEIGDIIVGRVTEAIFNCFANFSVGKEAFVWYVLWVHNCFAGIDQFDCFRLGCPKALEIGDKFQPGCGFNAFFYELT